MDAALINWPHEAALDRLHHGSTLTGASVVIAILEAAAHAQDGLSGPMLERLPRSLARLEQLGHLTRITMFDRPDRFYITDAGILALDAAYNAAND